MKLSIVRAASLRSWFACTLAVLPAFGLACDLSERKACEKRIVALVAYRSEAIQHAFGDLSAALPDQVRVKFVRSKDPEHPLAQRHNRLRIPRNACCSCRGAFSTRSCRIRSGGLPATGRSTSSSRRARHFRSSRRSTTRCGTPICRQRRPPAASPGTQRTVAPPMLRSGCRARWSSPRSLTSSRHGVCRSSTKTASTALAGGFRRLRGAQLAPRRVRVSGRAALRRPAAGSAAHR